MPNQVKNSLRLDWLIGEHNGRMPLNSLAPLTTPSFNSRKQPLVLIHGVMSEWRKYCNWGFLLRELKHFQLDANHRDIFIFRYATNSGDILARAAELRMALTELLHLYNPAQRFDVVASSLGGVLLQRTLLLPEGQDLLFALNKAITLSSPLWGTPLLSPKAMDDIAINRIIRQGAGLMFPELNRHVQWQLPLEFSDPSGWNEFDSASIFGGSAQNILRSKMRNYAALSISPLAIQDDLTSIDARAWLLKTIRTADYRKIWNGAMHYKLCWEIDRQIGPVYLFRYNDGLVPIFSSLWLSDLTRNFSGVTQLDDRTLSDIAELNPGGRILYGIDHSDLTDVRVGQRMQCVNDLLHPRHQPLSIAQYICKDLTD